jgi:hypothetical protein
MPKKIQGYQVSLEIIIDDTEETKWHCLQIALLLFSKEGLQTMDINIFEPKYPHDTSDSQQSKTT